MTKHTKIAAVLLLAICAVPAMAQDQEKPDKIVLEQKVGSVMTSTGGDYQSANIGAQLVVNESMMLSDGAKATVVYYYDNGKRKCTESYAGPNTFVIDDSCKKAAYLTSKGGIWNGNTAIIVGAAVIGGAIIGAGDNVPPRPISIGPNGERRRL